LIIHKCDGCNKELPKNKLYFKLSAVSLGGIISETYFDHRDYHFCRNNFECIKKFIENQQANKLCIPIIPDFMKHPNT
jgi:hypothetical protein